MKYQQRLDHITVENMSLMLNDVIGRLIFTRKNGHAVKLRCLTPSAAQIDMDSGKLNLLFSVVF